MAGQDNNGVSSAPLPPPLPAPRSEAKGDSFKLKVRADISEWMSRKHQREFPTEMPTGPYFFYGTLMDSFMLKAVLGLDESTKPAVRPAYIKGYATKLWGPYPALVSDESTRENVIEGLVYDVRTPEDGQKLQEYESESYRPETCTITYLDHEKPGSRLGSVFVFAGDPKELSEGTFDLKTWLKRMGRETALDELEAAKRGEQ